ncbi:MAG: DUF1636 domain-containing protein [Pseudomonadota bacterium]
MTLNAGRDHPGEDAMAEDLRDQPRAATAPDGLSCESAVLSLCLRCRDGHEEDFGDLRGGARLAEAVLDAGIASCGLKVRGVHCLSQCKRPCVVAVSGPDRFTYVFGDLHPALDAAAVVALAQLYVARPDGFMARADRPKPMQAGVLGRVPPLGWRGGAVETVDLLLQSASETKP